MSSFEPSRAKINEAVKDAGAQTHVGLAELIEIHRRSSNKDRLHASISSIDELYSLSLELEKNLGNVDFAEPIHGFRIISAYRDDRRISALISLWGEDGTSLVVANNQLHNSSLNEAVSRIYFEDNREHYFVAPLMGEQFYSQRFAEFVSIATPFVEKHSGNILHSILLGDFDEFALDRLGFIPSDLKIFWRQPFRSFDIRGSFGNFIAAPQWDPTSFTVKFIITD